MSSVRPDTFDISSTWRLATPGELIALQAGELDRLQHRLVVLLLVAQDQLVEGPVADPASLDHVERAPADLVQVRTGRCGTQQREITPLGARRLEGVIEIGEVLPQ